MYERSTQARSWTFTEKKLKEVREHTNKMAVEAIKAVKEEERSIFKSPPSKIPQSEVQYFNAKEEQMLARFFEKKLVDLCAFLKVSNRVRTTAIFLFKRFFLKASVMDYHPYQISFTTLFLATKIEEERMTIEAFVEKTRTSNSKLEPAQVLCHEITVLERLDFHISVFNPYLPLYGFYIDLLKQCASGGQSVIKSIYEAYKEGIEVVHQTLVTDLCFLYHPAQIALAAIHRGCREKDLEQKFDQYLRVKHPETAHYESVMTNVNTIQSILDESRVPSDSLQKKLMEKLSQCRNPATNSNSEFYKLKQQQKQKAEEEAHKRKMSSRKDSMDEAIRLNLGPPQKKRATEDEDIVLATRGTGLNASPSY